MANITKRGGKYLVRWRTLARDPKTGKRSERAWTCDTKKNAEALVRDIEAERARGRDWSAPANDPDPLITEAMKAYANDLKASSAKSTVTKAIYSLAHFARWLAPKHRNAKLSVLSRALLAEYYNGLDEYVPGPTSKRGLHRAKAPGPKPPRKYAEGSRQNRVNAVLGLWRWCADQSEYPKCPRPPVKFKMQPRTVEPVVAPTWVEIDALVKELQRIPSKGKPSTVLYRVAVILRYTGLRVGQALRLEWRDVRLDWGLLTVRGELGKSKKEKAGRIIPIADGLCDEMARWEGDRAGRIVPGKASPSSCSKGMRQAWARVIARGEARAEAVEGQPDHSFRQAFMTELKARGADDEAVKFLVGHSFDGPRDAYVGDFGLGLRETVAKIPRIGDDVITRRSGAQRSDAVDRENADADVLVEPEPVQ